jgi:hypothetical protein
MPTKSKTTTEPTESARSNQSLSVDRGFSFDFQPIVEPELQPTQYENAIKAFLDKVDKDGEGLQLTGTLSYAMNLVQARTHLKAPVRITWDKPAKGQSNVPTTIRLYRDGTLFPTEETKREN